MPCRAMCCSPSEASSLSNYVHKSPWALRQRLGALRWLRAAMLQVRQRLRRSSGACTRPAPTTSGQSMFSTRPWGRPGPKESVQGREWPCRVSRPALPGVGQGRHLSGQGHAIRQNKPVAAAGLAESVRLRQALALPSQYKALAVKPCKANGGQGEA